MSSLETLDLEKLAARMDKQFDEMRTELRETRGDTVSLSAKVDVLDRKVDHIDMKLRALIWVIGGLGSLITLAVTVGKALHWF